MKYSFQYLRLSLVLLLFLILNSCEETIIDPVVDTFPMSLGSEWHYQRTLYLYIFESDSSEVVVDVDTFLNNYRIWVSKDTVLNDTMNVTLFESCDEDTNDWIWRQYYYLDEEGLKLYAYSNNPGPISFKKSTATFYTNAGGIMSLDSAFEPPYPNDGLIYSYSRWLNLLLPLKKDSYWTYLQGNSPDSRIDKEVIGVELIKTGGMEFACYRVEWIYHNFYDFEIQITEWIAEEGLIKRTIQLDRVRSHTIDEEFLHTGQSIEVLQLSDYTLN